MQTNLNQLKTSIIDDIKSCDTAIVGTYGDKYPDVRHIANILNRDTDGLNLMFLTSLNSPKCNQIKKNPNCCVYYYNNETHHAVRLYGKMEIVSDIGMRQKYWHDEFKNFGYSGYDDDNFVLLTFIAEKYKIYINDEMKTGQI